MAPASLPYRRLAKGRRFQSLWLAPDHLLWVNGEGVLTLWSEGYARFYLRDVEALFTVPLADWQVMNVALGLVAALLALIGALYWSDGLIGIGWLVVAAGVVAWLGLRIWLGRAVVVVVQTAAGVTPTACLRRPRALRLLAELAPLIRAAQADLPPLSLAIGPLSTFPRQAPPPVPRAGGG